MPLIKIDRFHGVVPRVDALNLGPSQAQIAKNCDLANGHLAPFKGLTAEWTPTKVGTIKTIYLFNGTFWFHWTAEVDVVKGPIAGDTQERTYFTGDGAPKITDASIATAGGGTNYPNNSYTLGLPYPANIPTALTQGNLDPDADPTDIVSRTYVYTYVSAWGEEGPISGASAIAEVGPGQYVALSNLSTAPAGNYNVATKRIYRSATSDFGTTFLFVAEIPVAQTTFSDNLTDEQLGEELTVDTWVAPPTDMIGLTMMPNGMMAGFAKNELILSEPYVPHAYPTGYRQSTDFDIVAIAAFGTSLVVATKGQLYLATGTDPKSVSLVKLDEKQACVSKASMVDMGAYVIYASPDGLVQVSSGGVSLPLEAYLNRSSWQALNPSSIHAYLYEGQYIGFYDTGAVQAGFVFDPASGLFVNLDIYATAGYNDTENDALYLVVGGEIVKWNSNSTPLTYTWKSKKFSYPTPFNFCFGQVSAKTYPVTFKFYADGALKHTQTVANGNPFRLPGGYLATDYELEITGTSVVTDIRVATSIEELQRIP